DFQRRFPDRKPFLQHFEKAYLSHELHLRKPQPEIYTRVLQDAQLCAGETLFVDDRAENIAAAAALGLHTRLHPANAPLTELPL
ncbi:MAG: HAD-IA family hydrolase, partial [Bacteroidales bacterium]|nr:HAD-IA family hydrolase [Bacteroidales bacterium]